MIRCSAISADNVYKIAPAVQEFLGKASKYTGGRYTAQDMIDCCAEGHKLMWIAFNEDNILGVVITSIVHYPRKTAMVWDFTGGVRMNEWYDPMADMLLRAARDLGCDLIETTTMRAGWDKWHKERLGMEREFVTYSKEVGN